MRKLKCESAILTRDKMKIKHFRVGIGIVLTENPGGEPTLWAYNMENICKFQYLRSLF